MFEKLKKCKCEIMDCATGSSAGYVRKMLIMKKCGTGCLKRIKDVLRLQISFFVLYLYINGLLIL